MKTILYTLILLITSVTYAQYETSNLTPFVGNWEWKNGNQTFKMQLYIDSGYLKGNYRLIENNNGATTTIYKSNKLLNADLNFYYGYAIFGGSQDGILFHASVDDNVLLGNGNDNVKLGSLGFAIQPSTTIGSPITATWKVTKLQGLKSDEEPPTFSIPTDIIMTKVQ
jgi:hypothetical protein